jgi:ZIP family zinc transporter
VSEPRTLLLGALAGLTILFGLPIGRLRNPRPALRQFLNALAVGVLLFLVWDVLSHAFDPVDGALSNLRNHRGGMVPVVEYATLFFAGIGLGLVGLVYYERRLLGRQARPGPGAAVAGQVATRGVGLAGWSNAKRVALTVAVGIGLHNFGEGLAIGGSAARGEITLATLLVIGFGLHNATEGFGIVAPLAADVDESGAARIPSWGYLLGLAAIGGGPTFVGTLVGHGFTSDAVSVVFLTLAAGSIIYVVLQLVGVAARARRTDLLAYGLLIGVLAGFITDAIVTAAGA